MLFILTNQISNEKGEQYACNASIFNIRIHVIVIPRYEYDIVVITRVRGKAEHEC